MPTDDAARAFAELGFDRGHAYALFAYDVGFGIDLVAAEGRLALGASQRKPLQPARKSPSYFEFNPPPLRVTQLGPPLEGAGFSTQPTIDALLYDFGSVCVLYTIPLPEGLAGLLGLAEALYDNKTLLDDSRRRVEELCARLAPCIAGASVSGVAEDYVIYELLGPVPVDNLAERIRAQAGPIARLLRAEPGRLSEQEVQDALACQISYGGADVTLVDWNAALILGGPAEDVRAVLEFANVQLLESRFVDNRLDEDLEAAYRMFDRQRWGFMGYEARASYSRIARMRIDSALLNEGVNNALKLVGDQFLARVYRLASQRLHLPAWQANINRKLEVLEAISARVGEEQSARRIEILEWIIIALIAFEILLPVIRLAM